MGASILLILSMCYCGLVMFRVPVSKHFFQEKVINTSFCCDGSSPRASPLLEWAERFCFGFCFPFALYQEIVGTGIIGIIGMLMDLKMYCIHILKYHEHHGYEVIPSFFCVTKNCLSMQHAQHAHRKKVFLGDELAWQIHSGSLSKCHYGET